MSDTLHTTTRAGQIIGVHRKDVCRLIRDGKLEAKMLQVRGRGGKPRYRVSDSALQKFIDGMPSALPHGAAVPSAARAETAWKASKGKKLANVIEFV